MDGSNPRMAQTWLDYMRTAPYQAGVDHLPIAATQTPASHAAAPVVVVAPPALPVIVAQPEQHLEEIDGIEEFHRLIAMHPSR